MGRGTGTEETVESLEELSTVSFPRSVDEKEAYKILEFISGDLGYIIHGGNFNGFFSIEDGELKEKYEVEIRGGASSRNFSERANFSFSREIIEENNVFSGMRFFTTPGYSLKEHSEGEVKAWRNLRKSVESYFENEGRQQELPYQEQDSQDTKHQ